MTIDVDSLRRDMTDYYGTAMYSGFPAAVVDLSRVQSSSDESLVQMAVQQGIDLGKYAIPDEE